jgi:hypothetical protein
MKRLRIWLAISLMILLSFVLICVVLLSISTANADYQSPTIKTNVNEQTDLFEKSIDDHKALEKQLEQDKADTISGLNQNPKGLEYISNQSASEINESVSDLKAIKANDLNSKGREEFIKDKDVVGQEALYPDYNKNLNIQHKEDAEKIAKASDDLLDNLLVKLKDIGMDCKTVKGAIEQEPTYYVDIKQNTLKNTLYDQAICEELRNIYNCTDSVSLTCKKKGKSYGDWQVKSIKFSGRTLHNDKMNWGYAVKWGYKRWGWHITPYHPLNGGEFQRESLWRDNPSAIIADARVYIANHLKVPLEQIGENITFPSSGRGIGEIRAVSYRWRVVWDQYEFGYQYRDASDICEEWAEEWTERCDLK